MASSIFQVRTANECIRDARNIPIPQMLFDELWFEREVTILFADSNIGKTILSLQIAQSIASGKPIEGFGLSSISQGVLYCDFEMSDKQFHKRYSDDYQDEFEFHDHLKILKFQQNLADINISDKTFFREIKKEVIAHRCKVLIIDNITFLSRDALESAKEANDLMKVLKQLKSELHLSILIIAHTPKRAPYKPISLKDMAGSSGLSRFADAVICIGKSIANHNQIYIKQLKVRSAEFQYGEDNVILMTIKKVNNFLGAYFQGYDHERNHLKSAGPTELEQEILDLHSGNEMSRREIAQRVGCDKMKVQRTLQKYQDDAVST